MYYNIENSFNKLRKTPQPKVEVKKEGNIIEVKRKKTEITIPKGVVQESERDFLKMATLTSSSYQSVIKARASHSRSYTS